MDYSKHTELAAMLEDRLFTGEGDLTLAQGASSFVRIEVEKPVIFDISGVSYEGQIILRMSEGGTSTGGVVLPHLSVNRSKPTRVYEGESLGGVTYNQDGVLLRERTVDITKSTYGSFQHGIGRFILAPNTPYYAEIANGGNQSNTVRWTASFIFMDDII